MKIVLIVGNAITIGVVKAIIKPSAKIINLRKYANTLLNSITGSTRE
jgi:hypothetical protein